MKMHFIVGLVCLIPSLCYAAFDYTFDVRSKISHDGLAIDFDNNSPRDSRVTVFLSPDGILDKPLILVDPFDEENKYPKDNNANNIERDIFNNPRVEFGSFIGDIQKAGYDIVYVDFIDNVKSIQGNAFALVEAIKEINRRKQGIHTNALVGLSMGGLIGKYALMHMERSGMNHDTALYASFDTPHICANIPYALYKLFKPLKNNNISGMLLSEHLKKSMVSVAALQMSCNDYSSLLHGHDFVSGDQVKNKLKSEFLAMGGLPKDTKNVAFANGAMSPAGLLEGAEILNLNLSFEDIIGVKFNRNIFSGKATRADVVPGGWVELPKIVCDKTKNLDLKSLKVILSHYVKYLPPLPPSPNLKLDCAAIGHTFVSTGSALSLPVSHDTDTSAGSSGYSNNFLKQSPFDDMHFSKSGNTQHVSLGDLSPDLISEIKAGTRDKIELIIPILY